MRNQIAMKLFGLVFLAPLALAGCLAQDGDESTSEEPLSASPFVVCGAAVPDLRVETCQSGWPGTRPCSDTIASATDIVAGSISTTISGHNGEVSHTVTQTGPRQINFSATIHEGDAFNPGKNTTTYIVAWCRQPTL